MKTKPLKKTFVVQEVSADKLEITIGPPVYKEKSANRFFKWPKVSLISKRICFFSRLTGNSAVLPKETVRALSKIEIKPGKCIHEKINQKN